MVPLKRGMRRRLFFSGNSENKNAICIRSRQDYPGNKGFLTRATPGEVAAELTKSEPAILGVKTNKDMRTRVSALWLGAELRFEALHAPLIKTE
jgi:hypothetical protein